MDGIDFCFRRENVLFEAFLVPTTCLFAFPELDAVYDTFLFVPRDWVKQVGSQRAFYRVSIEPSHVSGPVLLAKRHRHFNVVYYVRPRFFLVYAVRGPRGYIFSTVSVGRENDEAYGATFPEKGRAK
jgi:hypothetical protein